MADGDGTDDKLGLSHASGHWAKISAVLQHSFLVYVYVNLDTWSSPADISEVPHLLSC